MPPLGGGRRLHELQPTMVYPEFGFPHRAERYRGGHRFHLWFLGVEDEWKDFWSRNMGRYPPWMALVVRTSANQPSASGVGVSTLCGAVSTRRVTVFVLDLSEL